MSKRMSVGTESQKFVGTLGPPFTDTPLSVLPCQIWSFYVKRYYGHPPESGPSCPPFEVAQGHWNRHGSTIYDFLLVIHSNHGSISYGFRDSWR